MQPLVQPFSIASVLQFFPLGSIAILVIQTLSTMTSHGHSHGDGAHGCHDQDDHHRGHGGHQHCCHGGHGLTTAVTVDDTVDDDSGDDECGCGIAHGHGGHDDSSEDECGSECSGHGHSHAGHAGHASHGGHGGHGEHGGHDDHDDSSEDECGSECGGHSHGGHGGHGHSHGGHGHGGHSHGGDDHGHGHAHHQVMGTKSKVTIEFEETNLDHTNSSDSAGKFDDPLKLVLKCLKLKWAAS